jgi:glycosyltransferase involved in cell wall biosynthesis
MARIADTNGSVVTVFTTQDIQEKIKDELASSETEINWIVAEPDESEREFLQRIEPLCEQRLDVLIVNTISGSAPQLYTYVRFDPDCPKLLWIYNVRTWLEPKLCTPLGFKKLLDYNSRTFFRRLILWNYDGLLVQYSPWKRYIEQETNYNRPVYSFPRIFCETDEVLNKQDISYEVPTKFTVPGAIIDKRDYDLVLNGIESRFDPSDDLELCLLGRPGSARASAGFGRQILDRCDRLSNQGYGITSYRDWIPQQEFNRQLKNSDVILSPLRQIPKERFGYTELHGQTTGTGAVFDALGYGKPLLLPNEYIIGDEISGLSYRYGPFKEFGDLLERFVRDEQFMISAKEQSLRNAQRFTLNRQRKRFKKILAEFVKEFG